MKITTADPAGNITLLVEGDIAPPRRAGLAVELMEKYGGEQVGYVVDAADADTGLYMMGGEFCGNALRSAGYLYAVRHGVEAVRVRISGCERPLLVRCDLERGYAEAEMPLPESYGELDGLPVAVFPGIAHALYRGADPGGDFARDYTRRLAERFGVSAAGLMFYEDGKITPTVYVAETATLCYESSCASGSAAAAAILSRGKPDGEYGYTLAHPGGVIDACAVISAKQVTGLRIGGNVVINEDVSLMKE